MLLQANDYLLAARPPGCELQIGGSDQWGNILAGVDLIRRKRRHGGARAVAGRCSRAADGTKLGKTTGARLWLDPAKTCPYQFHQHWMQTRRRRGRAAAADVLAAPAWTRSTRSLEAHAAAPERRLAQRALADEITELVHGAEAAGAADEAADVLFGGDPTVAVRGGARRRRPGGAVEPPVAAAELDDLVGLLVGTELASSKGDARRTLEQGSGTGPTACRSTRRRARRPSACCTGGTCCSEGQEIAPPRRDFSDQGLCARVAGG